MFEYIIKSENLNELPELPTSLTSLILCGSKVKYLPTKLPEGLEKFVYCCTKASRLPELPRTLKALRLRSLGIRKLPKLGKLERLNCRYNRLTSLPRLPDELIDLYCEGNKLTWLPKLPDSLTYLNFYENYVTIDCERVFDFNERLENLRNRIKMRMRVRSLVERF